MFNSLFKFLNGVQSSPLLPPSSRRWIRRKMGLVVGKRVTILENCYFGSGKIDISDDVFISVGCYFDGSDQIFLGNHVTIAPQVKIITSTHIVGGSGHRAGPLYTAGVTVSDGCWLGAGSTVMPGVTISKGCIVGAGALVTKSTDPDGLYVGIPAKRIKDLLTVSPGLPK